MIRGGGAPPGNWTQLHGLISGDPIQSPTRKTVLPGCTASSCGVFAQAAMKRTEDDYTLPNGRELRGELQFFMSLANDLVEVTLHHVRSVDLAGEDAELRKSGIEDMNNDDDDELVLKRKRGGRNRN